jgi:hypothetical protein
MAGFTIGHCMFLLDECLERGDECQQFQQGAAGVVILLELQRHRHGLHGQQVADNRNLVVHGAEHQEL